MSDWEHNFWVQGSRYESLAKNFERGIERVHPNYVTGSAGCRWCYRCLYHSTDVDYWEYRGESIL